MIRTSSYSAASADSLPASRLDSSRLDADRSRGRQLSVRRRGFRYGLRRVLLSAVGLGLGTLLFVALLAAIENVRHEMTTDAARSAATSLSSEPL